MSIRRAGCGVCAEESSEASADAAAAAERRRGTLDEWAWSVILAHWGERGGNTGNGVTSTRGNGELNTGETGETGILFLASPGAGIVVIIGPGHSLQVAENTSLDAALYQSPMFRAGARLALTVVDGERVSFNGTRSGLSTRMWKFSGRLVRRNWRTCSASKRRMTRPRAARRPAAHSADRP